MLRSTRSYPPAVRFAIGDLRRRQVEGFRRKLPPLEEHALAAVTAAFTLVTRSPDLYRQSVCADRWRRTLSRDGQTQLCDLNADPEELHDVAATNADVVTDLTARIRELPQLP